MPVPVFTLAPMVLKMDLSRGDNNAIINAVKVLKKCYRTGMFTQQMAADVLKAFYMGDAWEMVVNLYRRGYLINAGTLTPPKETKK